MHEPGTDLSFERRQPARRDDRGQAEPTPCRRETALLDGFDKHGNVREIQHIAR